MGSTEKDVHLREHGLVILGAAGARGASSGGGGLEMRGPDGKSFNPARDWAWLFRSTVADACKRLVEGKGEPCVERLLADLAVPGEALSTVMENVVAHLYEVTPLPKNQTRADAYAASCREHMATSDPIAEAAFLAQLGAAALRHGWFAWREVSWPSTGPAVSPMTDRDEFIRLAQTARDGRVPCPSQP